MSVEMYLKTSIDLYTMFVVRYNNDRGFECTMDFHYLNDAIKRSKELLSTDKIDHVTIGIFKERFYWKNVFSLAYHSDADLTEDEKTTINEFIEYRDGLIND